MTFFLNITFAISLTPLPPCVTELFNLIINSTLSKSRWSRTVSVDTAAMGRGSKIKKLKWDGSQIKVTQLRNCLQSFDWKIWKITQLRKLESDTTEKLFRTIWLKNLENYTTKKIGKRHNWEIVSNQLIGKLENAPSERTFSTFVWFSSKSALAQLEFVDTVKF